MEKNPTNFIIINDLFQKLYEIAPMLMVWGDVGVGKTTFALQFSRYVLRKKKKVFYLNTKNSSFEDLYDRILGPNWNSVESNFVFWNEQTVFKQSQTVNKWQLQVQKLNQLFQTKKVGLLVIDEITSPYLLEMSSDKVNSRLNSELTEQLASLRFIISQHQVPVILLNTFSIKSEDLEKQSSKENGVVSETKAVPHGGNIIDYWIDLSIKIKRTNQTSRMILNLVKDKYSSELPNNWSWMLKDQGFS